MTGSPQVNRDREDVRLRLLEKVETYSRVRDVLADPSIPLHRKPFITHDPALLVADAEWRLRWIDCAPEGANFLLAPLQDKAGVPCGDAWSENVGPGEALRSARAARGLCAFSGRRL